ncbi:MAG: PQQ-binding-like beta-propeller repeat protein, partial [Solimonas sp.]
MMSRLITVGLCWSLSGIALTAQGWPQWGGPNRNFMVEATGLAETWPASGPKRLWSRELGDGHSSIVVDADRLYTMYGKGDQEFVLALDRATGKTVWEKTYAAPTAGLTLQVDAFNVRGPHSTPLVTGDLLITIGIVGNMQAFEKRTGKVVWSHDLWREYSGTRLERGYACSPVAYKNLVIVTVGGAGQSLMAFDQKTGAPVWKAQNFRLSPSSPILISVDGQDQIVMGFADHFAGVDPATGALLWQHMHKCGGFN